MLEWKKTAKTVSAEGTTIRYEAKGTPMVIESRKRHIPHANGVGTWDHTTYAILFKGELKVAEKQTLKDAKESVERMEF